MDFHQNLNPVERKYAYQVPPKRDALSSWGSFSLYSMVGVDFLRELLQSRRQRLRYLGTLCDIRREAGGWPLIVHLHHGQPFLAAA